MFRVGSLLFLAVAFGLCAGVDRAAAQQTETFSQAGQVPPPTTRARGSKTELARRFHEVKSQYAEIKLATARYLPLASDAPAELKTIRLKIAAAMKSYDQYEKRAQEQRNRLNLLVELTEMESLRLQVAMDRLAKMGTTIATLVHRLNEAGDAFAPRAKAAASH